MDVGIRFTIRRALAYRKLRREAPVPGTTLQSKIRYKMAWDRDPLLTTFADKIAVRSFIKDRVGPSYLVPTLGEFDFAADIDFSTLPREYVLKVNHGSGGIIIVSEKADIAMRLPEHINVGWERFEVHPDCMDSERAAALLDRWLGMSLEWWPGRAPEWAYRNIRPRIYIEEFLNSETNEQLVDYKAFTFNGNVQAIRVMQGSIGQGKRVAYFSRDWNRLPITFVEGSIPYPNLDIEVDPAFGRHLVEVAERLMVGIDFARVDFIDDDGQLRVGEITNYPTAGDFDYVPTVFNSWMGSEWHPNYR